ncbi:MAG TPA: molybdopterin-binding/glycosyltransferase family 2 protein [Rhizomicrobium sp.]|jgi:molybdenum cofactor cytidylyltransferase
MQFGLVPIMDALGTILAHGVRAGEIRFKKGRVLTAADLAELAKARVNEVMVARLDADDVPEDLAATRIGSACSGTDVRLGAAFTGRVNLYAIADGVVTISADAVDALNTLHESITVATLSPFSRVAKGQMLATIKIIPFAAPRSAVEKAEYILKKWGPVVAVSAFRPMCAALISTFLPDTKPSLLDKNRSALADRLEPLASKIGFERRVPHQIEKLAIAVEEAIAAGANPIFIFGASAITDRRDVVPASIEKADGEIDHFGMPVDPGNLLLLGRRGSTPIVGLPSCARSPKQNGFDFVLWRLLAALPIGVKEITSMGVGGLLNEIPSRPQPRDERPDDTPRLPRIAAIVLAAGQSSRMGSNKLLALVDGEPMVRHAVRAASDSAAETVIVVTGNAAEDVRRAVAPLTPLFVENPEYSNGLSTSLKRGIKLVPEGYDGAIILLGDMPGVTSDLLDKLIAAFDPSEGRAICVATRHGERGNPVLWAHRFFQEMMLIEGDVGGRHLLTQNAELVCEVEADDDGPLTDIDTPQMLAEYRSKNGSGGKIASQRK